MTNTLSAPSVIDLPRRPHFDASRAAWIEHAAITSRIIRRAALRDVVRDSETGEELILALRSWSKEVGDGAAAAIAAGQFSNDSAGWEAALGLPTEVVLTDDGGLVDTSGWCVDVAGSEWVRYERWSAVGRVGHGFVCEYCRRLTQTG